MPALASPAPEPPITDLRRTLSDPLVGGSAVAGLLLVALVQAVFAPPVGVTLALAVCAIAGAVDAHTFRIPDMLSAAAWLAGGTAWAAGGFRWESFVCAGGFGVFLLIVFVASPGLGAGDVKFLAAPVLALTASSPGFWEAATVLWAFVIVTFGGGAVWAALRSEKVAPMATAAFPAAVVIACVAASR